MKKHLRLAAVTFLFFLPFNQSLGAIAALADPARYLPVEVKGSPGDPPKCDPALQVCPKNQ